MQNVRKFKGKVKLLSTHSLLCGKYAAVCRKIVNFYPAYDAAEP